ASLRGHPRWSCAAPPPSASAADYGAAQARPAGSRPSAVRRSRACPCRTRAKPPRCREKPVAVDELLPHLLLVRVLRLGVDQEQDVPDPHRAVAVVLRELIGVELGERARKPL